MTLAAPVGVELPARLSAGDGEQFFATLHLHRMRRAVLAVLLVQFAVSLLIGALMLDEGLPLLPMTVWLAALWSALAFRALAVTRMPTAARPASPCQGRILALSAVLIGVAWGCSLLLYPASPENSFAEKFLIDVLIAVAGAGSVWHAPQPGTARLFVLSLMVPAMSIRLLFGTPADELMVLAAAVYMGVLFAVVRYLEGIMHAALAAQAQNAELAMKLEQEATQRLAMMEQTLQERKRMERELAERERELRSLMDSMPDVVVRYDQECRRIYVSPSYEAVTGISRTLVVGRRPIEAEGFRFDAGVAYEGALREVMAERLRRELTLEWKTLDGQSRWHLVSMVPEFDPEGGVVSVLTVSRDVCELKRAEAMLHAREEAFRSLAENTPDTIVRFDRELRLIYVNPALMAQSGMGQGELLGKQPRYLFERDWIAPLEARLEEAFATGAHGGFEIHWNSKDGAQQCMHVRLVPERDRGGEIVSVLAVGRDITEIDGYRRRVATLAFHDPMTGLANRLLLQEQAEAAMAEGARHGRVVALMLIDLDRFKTINDTLGHATGDELLREAGGRLLRSVRASDVVARLGGDEFAIVLPEVRSGADAGSVAHKVLQALGEPFANGGRDLFITASIGVAMYPSDGDNWEELLKHADSAMYHAKARGRNNFQFYRAEMTRRAEERLQIEARLRRALANEEFHLHYQPQVALRSGELVGAEALLRWRNEELGDVPPDRFIAVAEDTGLIVEIGAWVLRQACRTAVAWNQAGYRVCVSVNLSTRQFRCRELAGTVLSTAEETGCRPEWLELEITESLLLEDSAEVRESMAELRTRGFRFAMDDFGTGYSALGYLCRFPIDRIKVDRSFISGISGDGHTAALVRAIISLADALHLGVVAEGLETGEQRRLLHAWDSGRLTAQGDLFGAPVSRGEFERRYLQGAAGPATWAGSAA